MRRWLAMLALAVLPQALGGQGVTTAAIQGTVVGDDRTPTAGATVSVTNVLNGRRWEIATGSTGRYLLEDVEVGGPYRIEVRAVGFGPETRTGIVLALAQRLVADFTLRPAAVELAPVAVHATADPVLNSGHALSARLVPASALGDLAAFRCPSLGEPAARNPKLADVARRARAARARRVRR